MRARPPPLRCRSSVRPAKHNVEFRSATRATRLDGGRQRGLHDPGSERRACGDAVRCDRARPPRFGPRAVADAARARLRQLAPGAARSRPVRGLIDAALLDRRRGARAVARGGARGRVGSTVPRTGGRRARGRARAPDDLRIRHPVARRRRLRQRGIPHAVRLDRAVRAALPRSRLHQRRPIVEDRRPGAQLRGVHRRAHRVDRKSGLAPGRAALAAFPRRGPAAAVRRREPRFAAACSGRRSPDAELAAIAEWARSNLQAMPGFRAWICIPDLNLRRPELVDALDAALSPRRFALDGAEHGARPMPSRAAHRSPTIRRRAPR